MDFELSADQVALRDGIRSLCVGRFPIKRVREGFDRDAYAELAAAGVFSLQSDGFGVADAAVVFEELGRAVVPGPLLTLARHAITFRCKPPPGFMPPYSRMYYILDFSMKEFK